MPYTYEHEYSAQREGKEEKEVVGWVDRSSTSHTYTVWYANVCCCDTVFLSCIHISTACELTVCECVSVFVSNYCAAVWNAVTEQTANPITEFSLQQMLNLYTSCMRIVWWFCWACDTAGGNQRIKYSNKKKKYTRKKSRRQMSSEFVHAEQWNWNILQQQHRRSPDIFRVTCFFFVAAFVRSELLYFFFSSPGYSAN